jgi:tyrosyl-tRNA synthetase
MGRVVQERYGQTPQVALTMPLLVGTDGVNKMSQSLGNYIGVEDEPGSMFGKTMSIPDEVMPQWFRLAADKNVAEVESIEAALESGELHPNEAKRTLARSVVTLYSGEKEAAAAEAEFDEVFRRGGIPEDIEDAVVPPGDSVHIASLIRDVFDVSGAEARRLVDQGAVKVDGEPVVSQEVARSELVGKVLKVGKRRFARLIN